MRVGIGYDIHRLVENRNLVIGGVTIPHYKGLLGHSDADVLCHAVMDAMLGAMSQGDIGRHFPDSDIRFKDISSIKLLEYVVELMWREHFVLSNMDSIIIAEEPKLLPYIGEMRKNIIGVLGVGENQINIKATTTEGLGEIGVGDAIAAQAIVLLEKRES